MHRHEHEALEHDLAPSRPRTENERPDPLLVRAAVAGRADVLGPSGLLRLQRAVGNAGVRDLAESADPVSVTTTGGSSLDAPIRADMEGRFGTDFSDVRVHTGDAAHASAKSVGAHAYTVGSNIVFQRGSYDPGSAAGRTMLAHELTHVVQQRSGSVDGTPTGRGFSVSDPSDRFEREAAANAERIVAMPAVQAATTPAAATPLAPAVALQRQEAEEDEGQVQGAFEAGGSVQREAVLQRESEEEQDESG